MSFTLTIPVLSESVQAEPGRPAAYRVRPLFFGLGVQGGEVPVAFNAREDRALAALARELRKTLHEEATAMRHDAIARWSFCPALECRMVNLTVPLRKRTIRGEFLLVSFEALGRRVVVSPGLDNLSFDFGRGEDLETRATEALRAYYRRIEKSGGPLPEDAELSRGSARVTTIELEIRSRQVFEDPAEARFAMLTGGGKLSGAAELERTGRCLNRRFSGDLHRAVLRDEEVAGLDRHFGDRKRVPSPLVLAGPSLVGKTAVIHEWLYRRLDGAGWKPEVWLLSPQRLIAGMSFVGQWEERVHAILKEAVKRKHVLYFDDLPGLFEAGRSRNSDLTVGHVLKSYLEDGAVRVVAEIVPEAWRKLREIDRGFADLWKVVRIGEPDETGTLRILTRAMQQAELERGCVFEAEVLPEVMNLQRRFGRGRAFPGKAVEMLRQLASRAESSGERSLGLEDVRRHFQNKSGIANRFLTPDSTLDPATARSWFRARIMGQPETVEALTDVAVSCAKQLNDPGRPLASLLFLGPTGVGKTESAKALAAYFFGTPERMLRFDMNEFVGGDAVGRLIGTRWRPHGLLTGAIRRQPYAVLLLDEIEKAHPAVFDLLLQLLGDGRLTDARGQTADFGNCVVILTSNLGARAARHQLGFGGGAQDEGAVYREAAEKFFRPELFNRLDRVVPFRELGRSDIEALARSLAQRALARQGVQGRRLMLAIDPEVDAALAEAGFQPQYGARALRRAIEQRVVEPLALALAALPGNEPAAVRLKPGAGGAIEFQPTRFVAAGRVARRLAPVSFERAADVLDACTGFVGRIDGELDEWFAGEGGAFDPSDPARVSYFNLREELDYLRRARERLAAHVDAERKQPAGQRIRPARFGKRGTSLLVPRDDEATVLEDFFAAADSGKHLARMAERAEVADFTTHLAGELIRRANRIALLASPEFALPDRVLLRMTDSSPASHADQSPDDFADGAWKMCHAHVMRYLQFMASAPNREGWIMQRYEAGGPLAIYEIGNDCLEGYHPPFETTLIYGEGPALRHWLAFEEGAQVFAAARGTIDFCRLEVIPLDAGESPEQGFDRVLAIEPARLDAELRVTRLHHENGYGCDLQSGLVTTGHETPLWPLLMPLAEVAEEFAEFFERDEGEGWEG